LPGKNTQHAHTQDAYTCQMCGTALVITQCTNNYKCKIAGCSNKKPCKRGDPRCPRPACSSTAMAVPAAIVVQSAAVEKDICAGDAGNRKCGEVDAWRKAQKESSGKSIDYKSQLNVLMHKFRPSGNFPLLRSECRQCFYTHTASLFLARACQSTADAVRQSICIQNICDFLMCLCLCLFLCVWVCVYVCMCMYVCVCSVQQITNHGSPSTKHSPLPQVSGLLSSFFSCRCVCMCVCVRWG